MAARFLQSPKPANLFSTVKLHFERDSTESAKKNTGANLFRRIKLFMSTTSEEETR